MSQQQPLSLKTRPMYFAPNLKIPPLLAELIRKGKVLRRHLQSEVFGKFISAKRGHGNVNRTFVTAKINMRSKKSKQDYFYDSVSRDAVKPHLVKMSLKHAHFENHLFLVILNFVAVSFNAQHDGILICGAHFYPCDLT